MVQKNAENDKRKSSTRLNITSHTKNESLQYYLCAQNLNRTQTRARERANQNKMCSIILPKLPWVWEARAASNSFCRRSKIDLSESLEKTIHMFKSSINKINATSQRVFPFDQPLNMFFSDLTCFDRINYRKFCLLVHFCAKKFSHDH